MTTSEMSEHGDIELHEAVLDYMTNTSDMSRISVRKIQVFLEGKLNRNLDQHKTLLKTSMHAFLKNLVREDEDLEIIELRNTTFKKKSRGMRIKPGIFLSSTQKLHESHNSTFRFLK